MRRKTFALVAAAAAAALLLAGCGPAFIREELPAGTKSQVVEIGAAEKVSARVMMGVGTLEIRPGAGALMKADFTYRPQAWEPDADYSVEGTSGDLRIKQPDIGGMNFGGVRSDWDLSLSPTVPMDLDIERGVGTSKLELGSLDLKSLRVLSGAGDTTLDLTGTPKRDVQVRLESGVGRVIVKVSRGTGVRVFGVHDGVGDIRFPGFTQDPEDDNAVVNDAWKTAETHYDIRLTRGVGEVRIEQE